ncbi:hypothetical protein TUSST3_00300 [Streptomyces sp. TUS-ST3]|nr:hypothetical protein TUSST3_00300 [Streptomyces sp. TUS-ST3]
MDEDGVKSLPVAPRFRYPADTHTGCALVASATTRVRLLSDRDAQIPLKTNDAGRVGLLLSSETEEDGARER